jgi:Domain of unknown function (DUF6504)
MTSLTPQHFIGEPIEVMFDQPLALEKKPSCPNAFVWQGHRLRVVAELEAWHAYERKGRMATNMRPAHVQTAAGRGSWGVGRFYFRVRVEDGRLFELYYDRAPQGQKQKKGAWFLQSELSEG